MTTLDRPTIRALAYEVAKIHRKEMRGKNTPGEPAEIAVSLLKSYKLPISRESISAICSCLSKMRSASRKKKRPAKKKRTKAGRSVVTKAMLRDAKIAENNHREDFPDDD